MDKKEEILNILIDSAAKIYGLDPSTLGPETRFQEDLHCKSANIVQFTTVLEDEFDIEVPYMEFNKQATFADAVDYIIELCEE